MEPNCAALVFNRPRCPRHTVRRAKTAERGYGGTWRKIRKAFLDAFPLCAICLLEGRRMRATDVDHKVPKKQGGTDDAGNLQSLCKRHHSQKTASKDGGFGN
jgi:5-methylcytosine-specific restriction protein A